MRREGSIPNEPPSAGDHVHASRPRGTEVDQAKDQGATLFGLAQEALEMLQREDVSSERLVWPVWIVSLDLVQCSATPPNDASQL